MTQPTRKKRTVSIGGATFDLFVGTDHSAIGTHHGREAFLLPLGDKIRVREVIGECGGGANNTAVGLARLGCDASFCGVVGDDQWGERLLHNLQRHHVDARGATVVEGETSSFSLILSADSGERVILYDPGTNAHLHDVTFDREAAGGADWIYLNHIQESACEIQDDLIAILTETHAPGLTWNPGGCQIEQGIGAKQIAQLLKRTHLLILNKEEATRFTKTADLETALRVLAASGATVVCVTDGKHGSAAVQGNDRYRCPILKTEVKDTTGAGDAFGIGMTWALLNGHDLPTALRAGTINAASVVGVTGAQPGLLTDIDMQKRLITTQIDVERTAF